MEISIVKEANRPDLPKQKMHIDVCAIPSFDIEKRALINHYDIVVPTEGILVPVQSLQEILADKLIALAYRARRIKPRDIWDIVWLKQRGIVLNRVLIEKKLTARRKQTEAFRQTLSAQLAKLMSENEVRNDFHMEMSRFIPKQIKERTLDNPEYWDYVKDEVNTIAHEALNAGAPQNPFNMG